MLPLPYTTLFTYLDIAHWLLPASIVTAAGKVLDYKVFPPESYKITEKGAY
jgi:hypothetical protein